MTDLAQLELDLINAIGGAETASAVEDLRVAALGKSGSISGLLKGMGALSPEVRLHEPHLALTPGGDGLEPYRIIAAKAPAHLTPQGRVLVEIGPTQAEAVTGYFRAAHFTQVETLQDFDGRDRVISAYLA